MLEFTGPLKPQQKDGSWGDLHEALHRHQYAERGVYTLFDPLRPNPQHFWWRWPEGAHDIGVDFISLVEGFEGQVQWELRRAYPRTWLLRPLVLTAWLEQMEAEYQAGRLFSTLVDLQQRALAVSPMHFRFAAFEEYEVQHPGFCKLTHEDVPVLVRLLLHKLQQVNLVRSGS